MTGDMIVLFGGMTFSAPPFKFPPFQAIQPVPPIFRRFPDDLGPFVTQMPAEGKSGT
jgi:hypothetical protein